MSLRPWYPTIILSATTSVSTKRSLLTERRRLWPPPHGSLPFFGPADGWSGDGVLSWQGELLLMRSADKDVPVEFEWCGCT